MRHFIIFILLSIPFQVFSQYSGENKTFVVANTTAGSQGISTFNNTERKVIGSQYLTATWLIGGIETYKKEEGVNIPIRYDVENNVVEYQENNQNLWLKGDQVKSFYILNPSTGSKDVYTNVKEFPGISQGFVKVLTQGEKYTLMEMYKVIKTESTYVAALDIGSPGEKYEVKESFVYFDGLAASLVTTSKKTFIQKVPFEDKEKLKTYMKKNKISLRNKEELVQLFQWMNQQ
ncbi:hypothetical protein MY04_3348 [Flammeovirga sp. MY04]|uniref:hypothetical protein n=1 Tax=Flammeovirga sp. MY04 TaxID=1191459 RepID=UPI00082675B3|nr:hypothetical protein [Flammeovirga sp. MY04]ANQ50710.2 hypothetical protein MY04_3348 [Flammeovirga sp. MY04]